MSLSTRLKNIFLINLFSFLVPGSGFDLRYTCCQAESGQEGCQIAPKGHVNNTNKWCDLEGYLTTLPPAVDNLTGEPRVNVYSLDCEMVYTTGGLVVIFSSHRMLSWQWLGYFA